jgi:hypothetical protein
MRKTSFCVYGFLFRAHIYIQIGVGAVSLPLHGHRCTYIFMYAHRMFTGIFFLLHHCCMRWYIHTHTHTHTHTSKGKKTVPSYCPRSLHALAHTHTHAYIRRGAGIAFFLSTFAAGLYALGLFAPNTFNGGSDYTFDVVFSSYLTLVSTVCIQMCMYTRVYMHMYTTR